MFVTFDPIDYTVTEGVDAFAVLTLVRSGVISETTMVTVTPQSGTALGNYYSYTINIQPELKISANYTKPHGLMCRSINPNTKSIQR